MVLERAAKILAQAEAKSKVEQGDVAVDAVLREGCADCLVEHVADQLETCGGADLIVLGTHGRHGLGRLPMDSHTEEALRTATAHVLLVNAHQSVTARRELDDSRSAAALARFLGGWDAPQVVARCAAAKPGLSCVLSLAAKQGKAGVSCKDSC